MTEHALEANSYIDRGISFGQWVRKVGDLECEIHSRKAGKIPGQEPGLLNLFLRDVEAAGGDSREPERAGACHESTEPGTGAATRIEEGD